jgi:ribosomal protein S18 acetylase RimI-like enzyme
MGDTTTPAQASDSKPGHHQGLLAAEVSTLHRTRSNRMQSHLILEENSAGPQAHSAAAVLRPGTAGDSPELFGVFRQTAFDLRVRLGQAELEEAPGTETFQRDWAEVRSLYEHLAETADRLWVAERGGEIAGFARSMVRDGVRNLTEFWVLPDQQSAGLGKELLQRAFPAAGARLRYVIATVDMRAQARYMKAGLYPRFSLYKFQGQPQIRPGSSDLEFRRMEATAEDARIVDWLDQETLGYRRRPEHEWFRQNREGFLCYRQGKPVGYGYAGKDSGPCTLLDPGDYPAVLAHAETTAARQGQPEIGLVVPTVNEAAVAYLLAHGYRIAPFFCQLMTSRPFGRFECYVATAPMFAL